MKRYPHILLESEIEILSPVDPGTLSLTRHRYLRNTSARQAAFTGCMAYHYVHHTDQESTHLRYFHSNDI